MGILAKHKPETKGEARARRKKDLEKGTTTPVPPSLVYGIKQVAQSVVNKKAKLVVIAHDVDPLEIVMWLPTLCIKMGIPFVIVKGKAALGRIVHQKQATCVSITTVSSG